MQYVVHLFDIGIFYYSICISIALLVLFGMRASKCNWSRCIAAACAAAYMFIVLAITVFTRGPTDLSTNYFPPFWAYRMILERDKLAHDLIIQIFMNVFMLVPLGIMIPCFVDKRPILWGALCSLSIEALQFVTKRGYFEIDDIIHNTLGILLGYAFYRILKRRIDRES